jgi:hypothetical protein
MGVRNLNKFILENCSKKSVNNINFKMLSGKTIVIDISIYMYKFESEKSLLENIYLMISIFRFYGVVPVFIFDGKSSSLKSNTLKKRREVKKESAEKYKLLVEKYENETSVSVRRNIMEDINKEQKNITRITHEHINRVKELIEAFGCVHYTSPSEADEMCVQMVMSGFAWACLSDDMDMFVYGCPRVLRCFNILNHTLMMYDMSLILNELDLSQESFREICVVSGTDYSDSIYSTPVSFDIYRKFLEFDTELSFFEWVNLKHELDVGFLIKVSNHFKQSDDFKCVQYSRRSCVPRTTLIKSKIIDILDKDGFIFID